MIDPCADELAAALASDVRLADIRVEEAAEEIINAIAWADYYSCQMGGGSSAAPESPIEPLVIRCLNVEIGRVRDEIAKVKGNPTRIAVKAVLARATNVRDKAAAYRQACRDVYVTSL